MMCGLKMEQCLANKGSATYQLTFASIRNMGNSIANLRDPSFVLQAFRSSALKAINGSSLSGCLRLHVEYGLQDVR